MSVAVRNLPDISAYFVHVNRTARTRFRCKEFDKCVVFTYPQGAVGPTGAQGPCDALPAAWTLKPAEHLLPTTVQLSGFVGSRADINKAVEVARGVAGATSVKNDMRLR